MRAMQLPKNINGTNGILYLIIIFPFIIKRARKTKIPINEEIKFEIKIKIILPFKKIATQME